MNNVNTEKAINEIKYKIISLDRLIKIQLDYMQQYYKITGDIPSDVESAQLISYRDQKQFALSILETLEP